MKKVLIAISLIFLLNACGEDRPVLEKHEYVIVDTLNTIRNGFGTIMRHDVLIKIKSDSTVHYGILRNDRLEYVNIRQINVN